MNILFFGPNESIVEKMLMDIKKSNFIEYNSFDIKKRDNSVIVKNLFHPKIMKLLPDIIKRLLFKKTINGNFLKNRTEQTLIVFINTFELFGEENFWVLISLLKRYYRSLKLAFYYYAALDYCYPDLFPKIKESFNLVMSFDKYSSDKYGSVFYGPINEKGFVQPLNDCEESDVFFAGNCTGVYKNSTERMDLATDCLQFITDNGKKCIFYLDGCADKDKKAIFNRLRASCSDPSCLTMNDDFIKYKSSSIHFEYITYAKSLGYLKKTKAILELGSPSDKGYIYTARVAQALGSGKKLITNSQMLKKEKFYSKSNCIIFEKVSDIDIKSIDSQFQKFDYDFSGLSMIEFIKEKLEN